MMSVMIKSGACSPRTCSACRPSSAVRTWNSWARSISVTAWSIAGSSSTTRIVAEMVMLRFPQPARSKLGRRRQVLQGGLDPRDRAGGAPPKAYARLASVYSTRPARAAQTLGDCRPGARATGDNISSSDVAGGMADPASLIAERLPGRGDELPFVAVLVQGHNEHAEGVGIAHFAVRQHEREAVVTGAACADDEFTNPPIGVGLSFRPLRGEALVGVVVAGQDDFGPGFIEQVPVRSDQRRTPVQAGAEAREVPIGERAIGRMIAQVGGQPQRLRVVGATAADLPAQTVDDDDVPGSQFVTIVAAPRFAGGCSEVVEVTCRAGGQVFVVPHCRPRAVLEAAPGGLVALGELVRGSAVVDAVPEDSHGSIPGLHQ